jgi:hypothetical protein
MDEVFAWVGTHPICYYLTALGALFSFLTLAVGSPQPSEGPRFEVAFFAATFLTLFAWRWPIFLAPVPLNPDESTWATGAIKATVDFAPWHGSNTGTSGPLNIYILMIPALFGAPITFASGRIIATCLLAAAMFALYFTVKWTQGARVARLSLVPPVVFLSLVADRDFVTYSSEHFAICLTTIALAACAHLAKQGGSASSRVSAGLVAGLCLGSAFFTKLQAGPIALLVLVFAAIAIVSLRKSSKREAYFVALTFVAALCVVPGAIVVSAWWTGELNDAYFSYVLMNFDYVADGSQNIRLSSFLAYSPIYAAFLAGSLLIMVAGAVALVRRGTIARPALCVMTASLLLLVTSIYVIVQPHRQFAHYLLFSIIPLSFCAASALGFIRDAGFWRNREPKLAVCFAALFVLPELSVAMSSGNRILSELSANVRHPKSAVALAISRYARPGEPMVVWGWASEYHVQTGTYPATHELETAGLIHSGPYKDRFRPRYLSDIKRNKPVVFVDAVSPNEFWAKNRASQGHEIFPELATYIRDNYVLKEEVSGVRIYVQKGK